MMNELDTDGIIRYQKFIGMLRWSIDLGRIDINTRVIFLLKKLYSPQEEQLDAVYQICIYLQFNLKENSGRILFDVTLDCSPNIFFELETQDKEE